MSEAAGEAPAASLELALMGVSTGVAFGGILLATLLFLKRRELAAAAAARFDGLYRLVLNKYYVDEIYDAAMVRPIHAASTHVLWRRVDATAIDGAVNGAGEIVRVASGVLRRVQTGSVRAYAASLFVGVIVVLAYVFWR